LKTDQKI